MNHVFAFGMLRPGIEFPTFRTPSRCPTTSIYRPTSWWFRVWPLIMLLVPLALSIMSSRWDFKHRAPILVLHTGYIKEPNGFRYRKKKSKDIALAVICIQLILSSHILVPIFVCLCYGVDENWRMSTLFLLTTTRSKFFLFQGLKGRLSSIQMGFKKMIY